MNLPIEELSLLDKQANSVGVKYASRIKSLRKLDLSYAPDLTDEDFAVLASMPSLEELRVGGSKNITNSGIAQFNKAQSLKKLTLQRLKSVTPEAIEQLRNTHPELEITFK